jgi:hypothetical protein
VGADVGLPALVDPGVPEACRVADDRVDAVEEFFDALVLDGREPAVNPLVCDELGRGALDGASSAY